VQDKRLKDQLKVLNDEYEPAGFSFDLINTTRTKNSRWAKWSDRTDRDMKEALRQGVQNTLNVFFVPSMSVGLGGGVLGVCAIPFTSVAYDGCVILNSAMTGPGSKAPFNEGKTAVHEVGHWLGLWHVFDITCLGAGDLIDDTTPQSMATLGCNTTQDSCEGGLKDNIHNFLDYSDDACMNEFTPGQVKRM
ncbi:zincin, partial [Pseudovirgaria hyperparasitica]